MPSDEVSIWSSTTASRHGFGSRFWPKKFASCEKDPRLYLEDILQSIQSIEDYTRGVSEERFKSSQLLQDAVVHRLEIIGEAAGHLPKQLTDRYADVPWRRIAGMRNRIAHEYFGILPERVWPVIQEDLAPLKETVLKMLEALS